jgi:hypothetical protein
MTLAQWCQQTGHQAIRPSTRIGAVTIISRPDHPFRSDLSTLEDLAIPARPGMVLVLARRDDPTYDALLRLEDYGVSSRCGAAFWLVPIDPAEVR